MSVNQNFLDEILKDQMNSPNPMDIVNVLQSVLSSQVFPMPLDESQPEKSWWRYFQKRIIDNTAMCYSCGAVFNRGPKQSTTSLNHHLKMYHRDLFIQLQQAKDAVLPIFRFPRKIKKEGINVQKACFNIKLIEAVKARPILYDATQAGDSDSRLDEWKSVAEEVGEGSTPMLVKKRWIQVRDRFKKEYRFAVRDNFSYIPKWPHYPHMKWFEKFLISSKKVKEIQNFPNPFPERSSGEDLNIDLRNNLYINSEDNLNTSSEENLHINPTEKLDLNSEELSHMNPKFSNILPGFSNLEKIGNQEDWKNDEDFLFAKLVQVRLKEIPLPKKREIQRSILLLLDEI
ncbi:hypothetical protein FO519_005328 [Halicephalobus sp. NKZ332]|nr:hypothetical protein FO519_005328 [Halicephalobus sp. NKZ332]